MSDLIENLTGTEKNVDEKKNNVVINEKQSPIEITSLKNESIDVESNKPPVYTYAVENMKHDENGNLVVDTTELGITVIHVDDDPTLNPWTFRTFFIGGGLACFGSTMATIYMFKPQSFSVATAFLAVCSYIIGEAMSLFIPRVGILKWLNPHPFNSKEHVASVIMATAGASAAFATEVIATQKLYYNHVPSKAVSIFLIFSSQLLGYGVAGVLRSTLVFPKKMLYPSSLPLCTFYQTLHRDKKETILRYRFFLIVFGAIIVWELLPQYMFGFLIGINVFCLARQNSPMFTNIFGGTNGNEGLGLFAFSLDWQNIGSGCLYMIPAALRSGFVGYSICVILYASVYYTNFWNAQNYPFLSQILYSADSNSTNYVEYNQTLILNEDSTLNLEKLDAYGLPHYTTTYALSILTNNLSVTASITYMLLNHWRDLTVAFKDIGSGYWAKLLKPSQWHWKFWDGKQSRPDKDDPNLDPHYRLMLEYDEVPTWWYLSVFVFSTMTGLICIYSAKTTLPWYAYLVSIAVAIFFIIIQGAQGAIFGFAVGPGPLTQLMGAFINPGMPLANMYFYLYSNTTTNQALGLLGDLKIGQYMKVPPRCVFTCQILGSLIGAVINFALMESITTERREILLSIEGTNVWSGQVIQSFNSASITMGALAKELYMVGQQYQWLTIAYLLGFLVPVPQWLLSKYYPTIKGRKIDWNYINLAITCWYLGYLCVGINSGVMTFFGIAAFTQYYLRRYHADWYMKYNFLLASALDGGTQVIQFILSFAVFGAAGSEHPFPEWWGNNWQGTRGHLDHCTVDN